MKRRCTTFQLASLVLVLSAHSAFGQTPWLSAPATPAALPPKTSTAPAGSRIVNLPPPPVSSESMASAVQNPSANAQSLDASSVESLTEGLSGLFPPIPNSTPLATAPLAMQTPAFSAATTQSGFPQPSFPDFKQQVSAPSLPLPNLPMLNAARSQVPGATANPIAPSNQLVSFDSPTAASIVPQTFSAGQLIAVVGTEHILAGDMAVFVEPIIEQNRERITSDVEEQKVRSQLTRQALRQYVEVKAIFQEFFRDMVGTAAPKEIEETKKKVVTKAGKIFFEKQVPVLFQKYKVTTIAELEAKLQAKSLSLVTLKTQFVEQVLASELERKYVPEKFEIDRYDLLTAYQEGKNKGEWSVPGRVRWRQLTVRFDKHDRQEADKLIREMGNQVFLGGKPFEAVAKQMSEGFTASEGGIYDWTTQGSLKSKEIDKAIFSYPLRELSGIIADDLGLHIVEVLEREEGHIKDFTEAQADLRESISNERRNQEVRKFRDRIMARTTVWTLWPEDIPGSRLLDLGP